MSRLFIFVFGMLLLSKATVSQTKPTQILVDRVVGAIGKEPILQSELEALLSLEKRDDLKAIQSARDQIVSEKLMLSDCKKSNMSATEEQVEQQIKYVRKRGGFSEERFLRELENAGLTLARFREQMGKEICKANLIQNKIRSRVQISKQDLLDAFKKTYVKKRFDLEQLVFGFSANNGHDKEARKALATSAFAKLQRSKNFSQTAMAIAGESKDGIDFQHPGAVTADSLWPTMEAALSQGKKGDVIGPILTPGEWHILHIKNVETSATKAFEDVEKELREKLQNEGLEKGIRNYVDELKAQTYVQMLDFSLRDLVVRNPT